MSEKFIVETSARHVHLTAEAFAVLFGEGKELTVKKMLSQPGQFASEERVTIVGPKKELPNVSILGPFRSANQVELSATDAQTVGYLNGQTLTCDDANLPKGWYLITVDGYSLGWGKLAGQIMKNHYPKGLRKP